MALTSFEWDEENRLSAVASPNSSREEYEYSADDLRRSKTQAAQTPDPQITQFVWDGDNLLQELGKNNEVQARYTYLAGAYGPLVSQRRYDTLPVSDALFNAASFGNTLFNQTESPAPDAVSLFFGYDLSANTRFLNDASGNITGRYLNTSFGKEVLASGMGKTPFLFGGAVGYYQDNSDRNYVRARYYSKGQAQWISRDPIGYATGEWNLYSYGRNSPSNYIDPEGTYVVLIRGGMGHGQQSFPTLNRTIRNRCGEAVLEPVYNWKINSSMITAPIVFPPKENEVLYVLKQICTWLQSKPRSSDPRHIWVYGHSYGGHVAGQIASPSAQVKKAKDDIERRFNVKFKHYVTAVSNVLDYPQHFTNTNYNLYSLSGDEQLISRKTAAIDEGFGRLAPWFQPYHYQSRRRKRKYTSKGTGNRMGVLAREQDYWYSEGKDRVIQGPNTPAAPAGLRDKTGKLYEGPRWFAHTSFDGEQGLSSVPKYQEQMISFIMKYLLKGHPGCGNK